MQNNNCTQFNCLQFVYFCLILTYFTEIYNNSIKVSTLKLDNAVKKGIAKSNALICYKFALISLII